MAHYVYPGVEEKRGHFRLRLPNHISLETGAAVFRSGSLENLNTLISFFYHCAENEHPELYISYEGTISKDEWKDTYTDASTAQNIPLS